MVGPLAPLWLSYSVVCGLKATCASVHAPCAARTGWGSGGLGCTGLWGCPALVDG